MKLFKKLIKKENGSITMTVLASMLFVTTVLVVSYFSISSQGSNQNRKVQQISKQYSVTDAELEERYNQLLRELDNTSYIQINEIKSLGNIMLSKKTNTTTADEYGNSITIPAGFKLTEVDEYGNAMTIPENFQKADRVNNITQGVVIEDKEGNQFVWIPVGNIKYEEDGVIKTKTINLGRYVFNSDGTINTNQSQTEPQGHLEVISGNANYYTECLKNESLLDVNGNAIAKDIEQFIQKTNENNGFYIGRYEARKDVVNGKNVLVENKNKEIYNYITQPDAAIVARNMYSSNDKFESDLINSYAWDTAILFLQEFGKENYSNEHAFVTENSLFAQNGTIENQCNVYDMASNCYEWSTETFSLSNRSCVQRGGSYKEISLGACNRQYQNNSDNDIFFSFRPIIYMK